MRRTKSCTHQVLVGILVLLNRCGIYPKFFAKQVSSNPVRIFSDDLVVQVFEQVELDRVTWAICRFNSIDDHTAGSRKKTPVEIADGISKLTVQLPLPVVPILSFHVPTRDPLTLILEHLEIGRKLLHLFKERFIRLKARCSFFPVPIEHAVGVTPVIL